MINILLLQNLQNKFTKFINEIFDLRLKRANLASPSDIANSVNKTDFDNQVKNVTSNKNELNDLSKKVKAISTKVLTQDLIDEFSIVNGAKCFSLGLFQKIKKKYIKYLSGTTR